MEQEEIVASKNLVFSANGQDLPLDIANKTVRELKEMGFNDIASFEMKRDKKTNQMKPHVSEEDRQKMQQTLKEMEQDENDPDYHLDNLGDLNDGGDISMDQPRNM